MNYEFLKLDSTSKVKPRIFAELKNLIQLIHYLFRNVHFNSEDFYGKVL